VLGIAVELALVVDDHIKVSFEEGGRSWWICYVGFAGSLAQSEEPKTVLQQCQTGLTGGYQSDW
jgi:hypothetical protein